MEVCWWTALGSSLLHTALLGKKTKWPSCFSKVFEVEIIITFMIRSRSESSWTAVVGEFDLKKTDPDEQVMKVNRIITHPKVNTSHNSQMFPFT